MKSKESASRKVGRYYEISEETYASLKAASDASGITMTRLVEDCIARALDDVAEEETQRRAERARARKRPAKG